MMHAFDKHGCAMTDEVAEIERQIAQLEEKRRAILTARRDETLQSVRETIRLYGFTAKELGVNTSIGGSLPGKGSRKRYETFKYHNPLTGDVWTGNAAQPGRKPAWVTVLIRNNTIESHRFDGNPPPLVDPRQIGLPLPTGKDQS